MPFFFPLPHPHPLLHHGPPRIIRFRLPEKTPHFLDNLIETVGHTCDAAGLEKGVEVQRNQCDIAFQMVQGGLVIFPFQSDFRQVIEWRKGFPGRIPMHV